VSLTNATVANNTGGVATGIFSGSAATVTVVNTIVAGPSGPNCNIAPGGAIASAGHNLDSGASCGFAMSGDLSSTDPLLVRLAPNGSILPLQALPLSPAVDAGDPSACPAVDQRGAPRPTDGNGDTVAVCDIGAYEL